MHKSGANIKFYTRATEGFPVLSQTFIWTSPVCFALKKWPSTTSMYLSVSSNEPGIQSKISSVMLQVALYSKIQLISCDLYLKSLLGFFGLMCIRAIDVYIFCYLLWYLLFTDALYIYFYQYTQILGFSVFQWTFLSKVYGFGKFVIKWSFVPYLKHVFGVWLLRSVIFLLELRGLKGGFL